MSTIISFCRIMIKGLARFLPVLLVWAPGFTSLSVTRVGLKRKLWHSSRYFRGQKKAKKLSKIIKKRKLEINDMMC
jgi:hypothetical protein